MHHQAHKNNLWISGDNNWLSQKCEIEHAMHSLRSLYEKPENEAVLKIDAKKAFSCLNRNLAIQNIKRSCPALSFCSKYARVQRLEALFLFVKELTEHGSYFGYNVNLRSVN